MMDLRKRHWRHTHKPRFGLSVWELEKECRLKETAMIVNQLIKQLQRSGCVCQNCGRLFLVDFLVSDEIWKRIQPADRPPGAGLLCGVCIVNAIEKFGENAAFKIVPVESR